MSDQIVKTLGGDRLGSGNKMKVSMHNFERSTHNLSRVWKSSLNVGTLVPCLREIGLPGDSFDIDIESLVKTQATSAPLFGSFKMQIDLFMCPMRLYNGWLHNNMLGIGLKMNNVNLPFINFMDTSGKTNSSSLAAYLGTRGKDGTRVNALGVLSYLDIFKNYYANKQEDTFYCIGKSVDKLGISNINVLDSYTNDWMGGHVDNTEASEIIGSGYTAPNLSDILELLIVFDKNDKEGVLRAMTNMRVTWYQGVEPKVVIAGNHIAKYFDYNTHTGKSALIFNGERYVKDFPLADQAVTKVVIEPRTFDDNKEIKLVPFKLDNLDKVRDKCLATNGWQVNDGSIDICEHIWNYGYANIKQGGLLVKTYQSDIYNNWLREETINGANGISKITAVKTQNGSFTIDSLLLANKVYNMLNRIAVSGGTYDDWQQAVYGVDQSWRAESPIYLGGMSREIYFSEVVSTADSTAEGAEVPLGSLAGKGEQGDKKGGFVSFKVNEPSYIMGIVSLTPRIDYSQGNWWANEITNMDQWHKPSLDGIGFQDLKCKQMLWSDNRSAGKQPAWINYMTSFNENYGDFAVGESLEMMVLNRNYETNMLSIIDLTTYIDPKKYNYIFADDSITAQNFWMQIAFDIKARRKMSAKLMPNL